MIVWKQHKGNKKHLLMINWIKFQNEKILWNEIWIIRYQDLTKIILKRINANLISLTINLKK